MWRKLLVGCSEAGQVYRLHGIGAKPHVTTMARENLKAVDTRQTASINASIMRPASMERCVLRFRTVEGEGDIPALIELARSAHLESRFSYVEFSEEKVRKIAIEAIANPTSRGAFMAFRGKEAVGFSYCSVGEYYIGTDVLIATIHNINVASDTRATLSGGRVALGLFKGIETWATARGAREVLLHVTSGVELARTHKPAKRMGYEVIGGSYGKRLG